MMSNRDLFREDDDALFAPIGAHPADHAPEPAQPTEPDQRVPLSIIDTYFDGDLRPDQARSLFDKLRRRPDRAREVVQMQRAIEALKRPVSHKDFTAAILSRVHARRPWLPKRERLAVWGLRVAAVFLLVGMTAAAFTLQRVAPNTTALSAQTTPVANVVDAVSDSTGFAANNLPASLSNIHQSVFLSPVQVSTASLAGPVQQGIARFSRSPRGIEPTEPTEEPCCVSAVGLNYSNQHTTVCDALIDATPRRTQRVRVFTISTDKK